MKIKASQIAKKTYYVFNSLFRITKMHQSPAYMLPSQGNSPVIDTDLGKGKRLHVMTS